MKKQSSQNPHKTHPVATLNFFFELLNKGFEDRVKDKPKAYLELLKEIAEDHLEKDYTVTPRVITDVLEETDKKYELKAEIFEKDYLDGEDVKKIMAFPALLPEFARTQYCKRTDADRYFDVMTRDCDIFLAKFKSLAEMYLATGSEAILKSIRDAMAVHRMGGGQ
ncbi:MAG: hypothetical protein J6Y62_00155 [Clostridia bacterium]|nr:hypothetical protein [Clostridia bacterium]